MKAGTAAVFLDKDGTLVENVPYNVDPARVRLTPGAGEALRALADAGYRLFVVSNQSGVARGYFGEEDLRGVERRVAELLAPHGVEIEAYRYCFHHPQGTVAAYRAVCDCRKPAPGMILELAREQGLDPARCWMVGDGPGDVEAGRAAGCRTVRITSGADPRADAAARGLGGAARA
ncbi:MAG TPA: HAD family hydrolase, partial [Longimicrobium sp.]|nr:HAD family hydrolase [Longimicrobium sp.]